MAHRCSYLALLLPQIRRHFSRWIGRSSLAGEKQLDMSTPWFSFLDEPLNWHHPLGLLYDVQTARHGDVAELRPWTLVLHFSSLSVYPETILPFVDPDLAMTQSMYGTADAQDGSYLSSTMTLQSAYYSSLKQADCLRFGTCKRMVNLSKAAQVQLWDALWTRIILSRRDGSF